MKAPITAANPRRGMCAADIDGKVAFVIVELFDTCEPEFGDVISNPTFCSIDREAHKNLIQGCEFDMTGENVSGPNLMRQHGFL